MEDIKRNIFLLERKIQQACKTYDKKRSDVNLVAVSKKFPAPQILEAIKQNCKIFGENYIKEAQEKWPAIKLAHPEIKLHFIGHLQSNKVAQALDLFDCIESLDSEKLALEFKKQIAKKREMASALSFGERSKVRGEINSEKEEINPAQTPEFFIQINIGQESQKSGIDPLHAKGFIAFAKNDCALNVAGLMGIPPENEAPSPYFALLAKIARENNLPNLSMGMSADFDQAIALGANFIRVGTAIFGKRVG